MRILFYSSDQKDLLAVPNSELIKKSKTTVILSVDYSEFQKEFQKCFSGETIVIFYIKNEDDLNFIESIEKIFFDVKLIINYSGASDVFLKRIFKLNPRVITNTAQNPQLLKEALMGLIKLLKNN